MKNEYRKINVTFFTQENEELGEVLCVNISCKDEPNKNSTVAEDLRVFNLAKEYNSHKEKRKTMFGPPGISGNISSPYMETIIFPNIEDNYGRSSIPLSRTFDFMKCETPNLKMIILPDRYKQILTTDCNERNILLSSMRKGFGNDFVDNLEKENGTSIKLMTPEGKVYTPVKKPATNSNKTETKSIFSLIRKKLIIHEEKPKENQGKKVSNTKGTRK